ncbi:hypothetical protein QQS21_007398 [Conoideocrella luteorostrata]|uniref:Uncharacterized protein n=1 Tax=Conoideocrella luteorostrata TaxID=1105319 RepID=A0AAJ0FX26_9HYPO|nr:hypothetical protein QQS21_007398 [Conoideocrella luteorostrata]
MNIATVRDGLTSSSDQKFQFPIHYAFDYLHGGSKYLHLPYLKLNDYVQSQVFLSPSLTKTSDNKQAIQRGDNAISLNPLNAKLPWPSGVLTCRQSKHWQLTLDVTRQFLKAFAEYNSTQTLSTSGRSIAEIAVKELESKIEEGWAKFPVYLFSEADEQRTKLLAAVNVFIFVFDDFWEMHDISSFVSVQKAFIQRMQPEACNDSTVKSFLENMIDNTIMEILQIDKLNGNNSGRDMIELMIRFFNRPPPPSTYRNIEEFLLYRHEDAAVPYVLGCTKFSLNSSINLESPGLTKYIRLVKDHVSIANDLGSWEKEKAAYDAGHVLYLINTVQVVKELFSLSSYDAAVTVTEGLQLQRECEIDEEIQRLMSEDALTADEWRFIDATLHVLSGNVLVSTIMSRYGGEQSRLSS